MMINASSPLFTVFYARILIGERIYTIDLINVFIVFTGIVLIAKPPFIFGMSTLYFENLEATHAIIALITASMFLQPNVFITLRLLKHIGKIRITLNLK